MSWRLLSDAFPSILCLLTEEAAAPPYGLLRANQRPQLEFPLDLRHSKSQATEGARRIREILILTTAS